MSIRVHEARLSLAWTKGFEKDRLLPYLAESNRYRDEFEKAKAGQGRWLLPWKQGERQHFWEYYLQVGEVGDLNKVSAGRAWKRLMPLRAPRCARLSASSGLRLTLEGYCFPHSVGVLATAFITPPEPIPLAAMVDRVVEVRQMHHNIRWLDDGNETHGTLDSLADALLNKLNFQVLGESPSGKALSEPLTTATIVDASGLGDEDKDPNAVEEFDRALIGLCQLQPGWRERVAPTAQTHGKERCVAVERGRVVWLPAHFSEGSIRTPRARALGCYHRNLALATLQARSLTALVWRADGFLPGQPVPMRMVKPVRSAVEILDEMLGGKETTYRSWSLDHQVGFYVELMKRVGQAVGATTVDVP